jgi:hypothetical protein
MNPDNAFSRDSTVAEGIRDTAGLVQARQAVSQIAENFAAKRVYAEPCQQQGVTVIPAAEIRGGAGVGGQGERGGGGIGMRARPVGAYVIKDGSVEWKPAFDLSRVVFRGQVVALAVLLTIGWMWSRRTV